MGIKFVKASSQYLTTTIPSVFANGMPNPFSISFWAYVTDFAFYSAWTRLFDAKYDADDWVQFCIPQAGRIQFGMSVAGTIYVYIPSVDLSANTWYHVVGTWNALATIKLYINATSYSTAGDASIVDPGTAGSLYLGVRSDMALNNTFYDGLLDDVRLYNRVLSAEEVRTINACQGQDNIYYGLQDRWLLNEGYSTQVVSGAGSVKDTVGALNFTATNSPTYGESVLTFGRGVA